MPYSSATVRIHGIFQALLSAALFLVLSSCAGLQDRDIGSRLARDRRTFEELAKMAETKQLSCTEGPDHVLKCDDPEALTLFERLNKRDGVRSVQTKIDVPRVSSGVYFAMATEGLITTNSQTKGLLYATEKPSPVVADTDKHEDVPRRYNALDGNWYVFATP